MTQESKTLYVFRDHYKKSSDPFRMILGLFFDLKNGNISVNEVDQLSLAIGASWEYGPPIIVQTEPLLYKQSVKFKPMNTEANRQLLSLPINDDHTLVEIKNFLKNGGEPGIKGISLEDFLKQKVSDSSKLYRDINTKVYKLAQFLSNNTESTLWSRIESNYNFAIPAYEKIIANENVPEEVLPNFYVFSLAGDRSLLDSVVQRDYDASQIYGLESPYDTFRNKFDTFITLNNNILFNPSSNNNFLFAIALLAYLEQYAKVYDNVSIDFLNTMSKRFGSIFANITSQELLNRLNQFKASYPMYIEIFFSTPLGNAFLDFLASANLTVESFTSFVNEKLLIEIEMAKALPNTTPGGLVLFSGFEPFNTIEITSTQTIEKNELLFIHDVEMLIKTYVEQLTTGQTDIQDNLSQNSNGGFTFIGGNEIAPNNLDVPLDQTISTITSIPRFNELMRIGMRSYKDIIDGRYAKSEILYFRVEKRDKNGRVIQNFCLPNLPDVSIQSFIDTQVKYNKAYTYKIYAGTVIYGTEYYYKANYGDNVTLLPVENEVSFPTNTGLTPNPQI